MLEINLGAVNFELSADQMARLTAVSDLDTPYPYDDFIETAQAGR